MKVHGFKLLFTSCFPVGLCIEEYVTIGSYVLCVSNH